MKTAPQLPAGFNLDSMLTTDEAALWLGLSKRELLEKSKGRSPKIAAYWITPRFVRFHPRAIIAKLAKDAGAPLDFVASMLNPIQPTNPK